MGLFRRQWPHDPLNLSNGIHRSSSDVELAYFSERLIPVIVKASMKTICLLFLLMTTPAVFAEDSLRKTNETACTEWCTVYKIIQKADDYHYKGDYEKALELYKRALLFRPSSRYIQLQIERMKELLGSKDGLN